MSRITSEKNTAEYDATDRSGVEILADGACNRNLLTIVGVGGDFTAGTVAVYIKGRGSRRYLAMRDAYGNAVSINLATADAVMIDKPIGSVRLNVSGISGATGWKAVLSGIDEPMSVASSSVPGPVIVAAATHPYTEDWNAALTSSYQKVATTTTATKSLRMSAACNATAYDIEYAVVAAGAAAPTANGQALLAGDDFLAGIPIGDIYARSATAQKLIVWRA